MATKEDYIHHVKTMEAAQDLAAYAKHSFEADRGTFVDGTSMFDFYSNQWSSADGQLKLRNRTPLQVERDRILYSNHLRRQTDKYHVLYSGRRKIVRNYTTHTMRMTHVTRSISRALKLNTDFAEAIALGSKVGATPFIHAAKEPIADWVSQKMKSIDETKSQKIKTATAAPKAIQIGLFPDEKEDDQHSDYPSWIKTLKSEFVIQRVQKFIPWARGENVDLPYSSGQESYWLLCTNPFTRESRDSKYLPDTMYGIWRHSRANRPTPGSFLHRCTLANTDSGHHEVRWDHSTYESSVVQYADDITWVIENFNDANNVRLLNGQGSLYNEFIRRIDKNRVPSPLLRALNKGDSGGVYTYFIESFVDKARQILDELGDEGTKGRVALKEGEASSFFRLSDEAEQQLNAILSFLDDEVFKEARVKNRVQMLKVITTACLDLLYEGGDDILPRLIEEQATLEEWLKSDIDRAKDLLEDDVHRVQLAVDIFANMTDQEIFDFVGMQYI